MGLLDLLKEDKINAKYTSSTYGGEYYSPCPGCGGKDRFKTWPNHPDGENWWCRQCGKGGTAVHYLMHFRNMSYRDACATLGITPSVFRHHIAKMSWTPRLPVNPPSEKWQQQALDLLRITQDILWNQTYVKIREWLNGDRGLNDDTIKKAGLGWLPKDLYFERELWALPEKFNDKGEKKRLWIPAGLVIPCFGDGLLHRIRVRRLYPSDDMKYYILPGSSITPTIWGDSNITLLMESELDAILLNQEAGDLATVIALGSSEIKPNTILHEQLKRADKILVSLDVDKAGANSSWKFWLEQFHQARRWPVIKGKDPTEAYLNGLNLRKWVIAGIRDKREHCSRTSQNEVANTKITCPILKQEHIAEFIGIRDISVLVTFNNDDEIKCIFLSSPGNLTIHIDTSALQNSHQLDILKQILESPSEKILCDAKSTITGLDNLGITLQGSLFDVKLANQVLIAGTGRQDESLHDLLNKYKITDFPDIRPEYEVKLLFTLCDLLSKELEAAHLTATARLEFDCVRATAELEKNGILLDRRRLETGRNKLTLIQKGLEAELHDDLGGINLNSTRQLINSLNAKEIAITNTRQDTLLDHINDHPCIRTLYEYKSVSYKLSAIENLLAHINSDTDRVHPKYKQLGAPTGRYSCSSPPLQAIPKESFRACFIASPGQRLVIADYSQIELRVLAEITQDEKMMAAFRNGEDLHKLTASVIMGAPLEKVTTKDRQAAKAVNFGLIYGMGAKELMNYAYNTYKVSMTLEQANRFKQRYFDFYKGINEWHQRVGQSNATETRTILERRRKWKEASKITELLNSPVQGTAADIMKEALVQIMAMKQPEWKIVGCIHDEVIMEIPEDQAEAASVILVTCMEHAAVKYLKSIPVIVDLRIANNWSEK
jgi:DNA polymerase-1